MTYKLKAGEKIKDGKLFGWTGQPCPKCNGTGEFFWTSEYYQPPRCDACAGTGEEWDVMPEQPGDIDQ
jgi:DnaJ-class molecular chaperone